MEEKGILNRVEKILRNYPKSRNSDQQLMCYVINEFGYSIHCQYWEIEQAILSGKIPSHESVSRARRKIQSEHEELRGIKQIVRARKEKEKRYKEFYGNGN